MHQAGFGVGGGHEARPGEMPFRAQQSGSGEDHRSRLDPWGETREQCKDVVLSVHTFAYSLSGWQSYLCSDRDNLAFFVSS